MPKMSPSPSHHEAAQAAMLQTFHELNGSQVEELAEEPTPLEFMRYVARNAPFVVRRGAAGWKAVREWDAAYLKGAMAGQTVNVAVTPFGNADAPTFSDVHGKTVISKPHEEAQAFDEFLEHVIRQEGDAAHGNAEIRYAQTQNDNLRDEYLPLFPDVQKDIPFARIALQKQPDAINLWIGNSRSVTALHKDNFENIFVQVIGRKHFVLLPPLFHTCVNERLLAPATYTRGQDGGLTLRLDADAEPVPLATWDPDRPLENAAPASHLARPLRVTLEPGDMLYLPAMWYHKVKQSCAEDDGQGFVLAVNYWYDMDFSGPLYPMTTFLRSLSRVEGASEPRSSITSTPSI